ncbi:NAD-dependent epimerase/dehydratase family protein [Streptomyces sp. TLI_171]|uniref:NAD-dependent epimerase/dehydratase family protein n=1 Tax=Streptomyces sp. TLI_171 TaxID=1938859 RepID=UPI000C17DB95|nr:NAD-dependent epimerase/dehydratase family protein [Streptomyces sp. TLI_171]RKE19776.1 nucleoside-diphosphate-sugar epimerase [Streptomyces sp. TLI_171]
MDILLLGGSKFLGRAYAAEALARGHRVTTFNRGVSRTDLPGVEAVHGDRTSLDDLRRLVDGRRWDAVVDTSGQQPHDVATAARLLADRVGHYGFVSSVHAFADWPAAPVDADSATLDCAGDLPPDQPFANALKAGCERALLAGFPGPSAILNCGLLIGPHEPIGRLPWWLDRVARGGRVLAPGTPDSPLSLIDARDFAAFGLDLAEQRATGRYVTTSPVRSATMGEFLAACRTATGSDAEFVWTSDETLLAAEVSPWVELPLWAPATDGWHGTWRADPATALAAGLRIRPLLDTVRDTWAWLEDGGRSEVAYRQLDTPLGIDPEKEKALL